MEKIEWVRKGERLEEQAWGDPVGSQAMPGLRGIKQGGWVFLFSL